MRFWTGSANLARRVALGQAMRSNEPLVRSNVAVSLRRDEALFYRVRHRKL